MAEKTGQNQDASEPTEQSPRKRRRRRATVAGTGPAWADGPEPRLNTVQPKGKQTKKQPLSERDRWMLEEKPPHY